MTKTGDNLANVIQYLAEQHGDQLERIFGVLRSRVPRIERVLADTMPDGRLLLQIKDAPFHQPVLAKFASDGTLKMLAYLVLLHDPEPPPFTGIEEPENFLHPRLLPELAEECRVASAWTQLVVTTHSPFFLNALRPEEVRVLWRDDHGYTQAQRLTDLPGISAFVEQGALPGQLWMEGQFGVGNPLVNQGAPTRPLRRRRGCLPPIWSCWSRSLRWKRSCAPCCPACCRRIGPSRFTPSRGSRTSSPISSAGCMAMLRGCRATGASSSSSIVTTTTVANSSASLRKRLDAPACGRPPEPGGSGVQAQGCEEDALGVGLRGLSPTYMAARVGARSVTPSRSDAGRRAAGGVKLPTVRAAGWLFALAPRQPRKEKQGTENPHRNRQ
jgi:hypothetical protein